MKDQGKKSHEKKRKKKRNHKQKYIVEVIRAITTKTRSAIVGREQKNEKLVEKAAHRE